MQKQDRGNAGRIQQEPQPVLGLDGLDRLGQDEDRERPGGHRRRANEEALVQEPVAAVEEDEDAEEGVDHERGQADQREQAHDATLRPANKPRAR